MARQVREKSVSARMEIIRMLLTPLICGTIWMDKRSSGIISRYWRDGTKVGHGYNYPLQCKIPILIHERLISNGKQRNLPCLDGRRSGINWKQLDIQSVQFI